MKNQQESPGRSETIAVERSIKSKHGRSLHRGRKLISGARYLAYILRVRPAYAVGYIIIIFVTSTAILAEWIAPYSPITANPADYLLEPSWRHLLGTDATGMDIFSRIIYSARIDMTIAFIGTVISSFLGSILGAFVGYYDQEGGIRGFGSGVVMRAADVIQAFPVFVFAIALVAVFGQSTESIVFSIAFVNIPIYLRLMRSQVISIRKLRFVEASLIAGLSDRTIILRHIIPNSIAPVLSQLSTNFGWAILLTAALSFVGAGVQAPTPEWGSMIAMGYQNVLTGQWWPSVFPGIALAGTVLGFSLIGASVEFLADPSRRRALGGTTQEDQPGEVGTNATAVPTSVE